MEKDTDTGGLKFHFRSKEMQLSQRGELQEVVVSDFVRKGTLLVSAVEDDTSEELFLIAGDNCELSSSEDSILAIATGYPKWEINDSDQCVMSVEPLVEISKDKMVAEMTIYPVIDVKTNFLQDLLMILADEGVSFGIDEQTVQEAIAQTEDEEKERVTFIAAQGEPALHGMDAFVRTEVEIGSIAGEMQKDGSLDFKERRIFVYVDEGQLIATVVPATTGELGQDVKGGAIEPRPGRDVTVRVTEDAVFDEGRGVVIAGKGGVVSVVSETSFKVSSKQTISGDIDFNTGNIYAKNNVDITGCVKPDFVVAVRGDIRIREHIQSATVSSHGNLVVSGGVMGDKSQLNIRGDVDLNFVERGTVVAGGNIIIRQNAYYGNIEAGGDILGGNSSKIVGGRVVCGGKICIGDIGSASADPAFVAVGTDVARLNNYEKLRGRVVEIEEKIGMWLQRYGEKAEKTNKIVEVEQELSEIRVTLVKLNLIKGTPVDSLKEDEHSECLADLVVNGKIVAGTVVRIGNMTMTLEKNLEKQRFRIDSLFKAIVADSL